jgi:hypothetical protein
VALYDDHNAREMKSRELRGKIQQASSGYMKALLAFKAERHQAVYPDANHTLRLTFGNVAGRSLEDTDGMAWAPFTTLRGILAKNTGQGEFNAPAAEIGEIKAGHFDGYYVPSLKSIPVNFLATLDITGGNSGSAILNDRGQIVGLVFDGTLDSVLSDWDFDPARTRAIGVDVRYMLWQMKVVDKAENLLREMGVPGA